MASARIVLFGDTHLGFDQPAHQRTQRRRRGDDFFANFRRVLDYTAATRPDVLVHGGDLFHRSRVAPAVVEGAFAALAGIADLGVPVLLVPGNHDRSRLPPSLWLGHPDIHVFDRPRTVALEAQGLRLAFSGFPFAWGDLRESFPGLLQQAGFEAVEAEARFLCMHHTVAGARVGSNGYTFRSGSDVIRSGQLPTRATAILSGHIHHAQVLDAGHPPVFYPGSVERTSFAERNEPKGFYDLVVESAPGRAASVSKATFIELPARPMFDLHLPGALEPSQVRTYLAEASRGYPPDAVVRLVAGAVAPDVLERFGSGELRSIFPPTMNVQPGWGLAHVRR